MLKEELENRANQILDETKEVQEKYREERVIIFNLLKNLDNKFNLEILENIIKIYEKNAGYKELEELKKNIDKQEIRKEDENGHINLFMVEDEEKNRYSFFTRENAKKFVEDNKGRFGENTQIKIIKNENMDLEKILYFF